MTRRLAGKSHRKIKPHLYIKAEAYAKVFITIATNAADDKCLVKVNEVLNGK